MYNTITIEQFMECINYRITEGSDFLWNCYGSHAFRLESSMDDYDISVVFDRRTQTVYEMEAWDNVHQRIYRWFNPGSIDALKAEHQERDVDFMPDVDDYECIDLDLAEDILEKAGAIVRGEPYDDRVLIHLDMTEADMMTIMLAAHTRDITLNEFMNEVIRAQMERGTEW